MASSFRGGVLITPHHHPLHTSSLKGEAIQNKTRYYDYSIISNLVFIRYRTIRYHIFSIDRQDRITFGKNSHQGNEIMVPDWSAPALFGSTLNVISFRLA